jgi:homoserine O-acetyltransferase
MIDPPTNSTATQPGEVGIVRWKDFHKAGRFDLENGGHLEHLQLRYETYGRLNKSRDNAILVCHALSGDHHCAGIHGLQDPRPGWWNNIIGPGKPLDTNKYYIICSNCLGGCQGSSGPTSIHPDSGTAYGLSFPIISIADMVRAQHALLTEELGLETLYAAIGGSMGGMQVLQWGITYPEFVQRLLPMATTARQNAQAIAFNEVGRMAIMQDPAWEGGGYAPGAGPRVGLAVARMMAHITYLSDAGLEEKFGREKVDPMAAQSLFAAEFEVESYLRYQGHSFTNRFDANSYLYLTKALDRFDLYGSSGRLEERLNAIRAKTLVIAFSSDWLFPPKQNRAIVHALLRCGKKASYAELDSTLGHDSFLVHDLQLYELVEAFLTA